MAANSWLTLRTASAIVALVLASPGASAQANGDPTPQVRMKLQDFASGPDGAKRLASLQKAVTKMKSLDGAPPASADFRRSWTYWANIHGYLGPGSKFQTLAFQEDRLVKAEMSQFLPYLVGTTGKPGFKDQTPPDAIAKAVWATCQHSPQGQQLNFFGWHRMYLYYFERVLRWAANDPTLSLPYWDYTDPAQTALPDAFQDQGSPLYDWRRSEALNEGLSTLNPQITDIDGPLTTDTNFLQYEGDIESGVHGNVHCSVGQTCPVAVMGLVGLAANDPIFYAHHANIDRMWSCWQHSHPTEKPGDWQDQQFSLVDENGAKVTRPVRDFLDTRALGYTYDNEGGCTRSAAPQVAAAQSDGPQRMTNTSTGSKQPIALDQATTSVTVSIAKPKLNGLAAGTPGRTTLMLEDVSALSDPGALLNVFVAHKDAPDARQYVGTINWFGVFDPMGGMKHEGRISRTFRYDITRQMQALQLADTGDVTVTFEATSGLVPSAKKAATQGFAPAPAAAFRTGAKIAIGDVRVR